MEPARPSPDALLERVTRDERARLRVYIGAAPGVGKTYTMLEDARALRARGLDVVIGFVETYGRAETAAQIGDLEIVPRIRVPYRGVEFEEMDLDGLLRRRPQVAVVDELAHSNLPGCRNEKRYQDVLELVGSGINVMTAVNIQHLETLNDAVARVTGVRVRETVPDTFLDRADEVINVDVTVEELRTRLRQGKIYTPDKVEQALSNFFRKGNLSTLRELALRAVADEVGEKAATYRVREGLEPALIPERVMVGMSSYREAERVIRAGARIAGRLGARWYAGVRRDAPRASWTNQGAGRGGSRSQRRHGREPGRDGGPGQSRSAERGLDRVRVARGHHARHLRTVGAVALGPAPARVDHRSIPARGPGCGRAGRAPRAGSLTTARRNQ